MNRKLIIYISLIIFTVLATFLSIFKLLESNPVLQKNLALAFVFFLFSVMLFSAARPSLCKGGGQRIIILSGTIIFLVAIIVLSVLALPDPMPISQIFVALVFGFLLFSIVLFLSAFTSLHKVDFGGLLFDAILLPCMVSSLFILLNSVAQATGHELPMIEMATEYLLAGLAVPCIFLPSILLHLLIYARNSDGFGLGAEKKVCVVLPSSSGWNNKMVWELRHLWKDNKMVGVNDKIVMAFNVLLSGNIWQIDVFLAGEKLALKNDCKIHLPQVSFYKDEILDFTKQLERWVSSPYELSLPLESTGNQQFKFELGVKDNFARSVDVKVFTISYKDEQISPKKWGFIVDKNCICVFVEGLKKLAMSESIIEEFLIRET